MKKTATIGVTGKTGLAYGGFETFCDAVDECVNEGSKPFVEELKTHMKDDNKYATKRKISDEQMKELKIIANDTIAKLELYYQAKKNINGQVV